MSKAIEDFFNQKKQDELTRKSNAIIRAIKKEINTTGTKEYDTIVETKSRDSYNKDVYTFIEQPNEEQINALYELFYPQPKKEYKVKNGWITFIGVLVLIELIAQFILLISFISQL